MNQNSNGAAKSLLNRGLRNSTIYQVIMIIIVSLFIGSFFTSCTPQGTNRETAETTERDRQTNQDTGTATDRFFADLSNAADNVRPSVVRINVGGRQGSEGVGSGVIYRENGYIITNNHVVDDVQNISVTIGSSEVDARFVAGDPETDLAVIRVNRNNLNAADFGSVGDLQVGDPVFAIGNPFGFEHTVTFGIISGLNRNLAIPGRQNGRSVVYTDLIQTDAAINPGNSGGALCNASGEVIGINTIIITESGAFSGLGFAIPVDTATDVADQLTRNGRASHPYIGITGRDVGDLPEDEDVGADRGVVIVEVVPGGPAARAGLRAGDIITEFNNEPVEDLTELIALIRQEEVGDRVEVTYRRGSRTNTATLTLAERPRQ